MRYKKSGRRKSYKKGKTRHKYYVQRGGVRI